MIRVIIICYMCICNCICVCNCICICFCICICIRIGRCIRLLLLYDSRHDIHNHYRRRHHNYCNQHFARSTKAQEVSAIPTPRTLENCHLENAARTSITVIILPLACAEVGFWRIRFIRARATG